MVLASWDGGHGLVCQEHFQEGRMARPRRRPWPLAGPGTRELAGSAQRGRALRADGLRDAAPRSRLRPPGPGVRPVPPAASPLASPGREAGAAHVHRVPQATSLYLRFVVTDHRIAFSILVELQIL